MKSLLKKDVYLLWKSVPFIPFCILLIGFVCAWGSQSNLALLCELGILTASMIEVVLEIEEGNRWHILQDTMPVSRAKIVREKYMLLCLAGLSVSAMQALLNIGYSLIAWGRVEAGNILFLPMIAFASAMLWGGILLPFCFRLGGIRGRSVYYIVLAVGLLSAILLRRYVEFPDHIPVHPLVLMLGLLGMGVLLCVLSCFISTRLYCRRDLR